MEQTLTLTESFIFHNLILVASTDSFIVQGFPLRQENFDLPIGLDCEITHSRVGAFMGEERCRQPAEKLKLNLCQQKNLSSHFMQFDLLVQSLHQDFCPSISRNQ